MSSPPSTRELSPDEASIGIPRAVHFETRFAPLAILPPKRGELIGRFRIERRLGHGGMGIVFAARDRELGRRVAVKLVRHRPGEPPDPRFVARLRREAQALARLSHENVVGLYEIGSTTRGIFLAMEHIAGKTLAEWILAGPRAPKEILDVFLRAGRGLAAAHAAGIIHRDFKPSNVIVTDAGRVVVVDFGLARATDDCARSNSDSSLALKMLARRLTRTNMIIGTKGYMAPEQLLGLPVSPRCDQFSFCVALYEALYGRHPYPGDNAVETARAYAEGQLRRPPRRRGVPPRVARALARGLAVEPEDRFADMHALLHALTPKRSVSVRRWGLLAAFVATASASVGATLLVDRDRPAPPEPVCEATLESSPRSDRR